MPKKQVTEVKFCTKGLFSLIKLIRLKQVAACCCTTAFLLAWTTLFRTPLNRKSQTASCQKAGNGTRFSLVFFDSFTDPLIPTAGFQKTSFNFNKQGKSSAVFILKILTLLRKFFYLFFASNSRDIFHLHSKLSAM